jgi:hypothetical protein
MKIDLRKVRRIARAARKWAEEYAEYKGMHRDLMCLCAIASAELHKKLRKEKQPSILCENREHCFVMCGDYVVDITATQFGIQEDIYIRKHEVVKAQSFYRINNEFSSVKKLREHQKKEGWPRDQIALA